MPEKTTLDRVAEVLFTLDHPAASFDETLDAETADHYRRNAQVVLATLADDLPASIAELIVTALGDGSATLPWREELRRQVEAVAAQAAREGRNVCEPPCEATISHGRGHQTRSRCDRRGPHVVHTHDAGWRRFEWTGTDASTGFFDEDVEVSDDAWEQDAAAASGS